MTLARYCRDYLNTVDAQYKDALNYPDGCVMTGAQYLYEATGDEYYRDRILRFGEKYVSPEGLVRGFDPARHNVDQIRCGTLLFFLHEQTGDERYRAAIDGFMANLRTHPRTGEGSFWHKEIYPWQVWLDGLYMAMPFYLLYDTAFDDCRHYNDVTDQFRRVRERLYNPEKKLYHHAWDEKRAMVWADPVTGRSPNFWLRAIGWWVMALADCFDILREEAYDHRRLLQDLLLETLEGLLPYRDPATGLFHQLVDLPQQPGNYLETSGSAMAAYALLKGSRLGMLHAERFAPVGEEILLSLQANMLPCKHGKLSLQNVCASAGLGPKDERDGSVEYYLSERIVPDNAHGAAALMMAYAEWMKWDHIRGAV